MRRKGLRLPPGVIADPIVRAVKVLKAAGPGGLVWSEMPDLIEISPRMLRPVMHALELAGMAVKADEGTSYRWTLVSEVPLGVSERATPLHMPWLEQKPKKRKADAA